MRGWTFTSVVLASSFLAVASVAEIAMAQFGPYGGYNRGWGAYPYAVSSRSANVTRQLAAQRHAASFSQAQRQTANMQRGLRSATMNAARSQIASMGRQKQSYKDWWFQTQQQQSAQRRMQPRSQPPPVAPRYRPRPVVPRRTVSTPRATAAKKSADIINWPARLSDPRFAKQRARVEGPFRRQASGGGDPTVKDYREIIDATGQMKATLKEMAYEISAGTYLEVEKFLDSLAAEAQERIKGKAGTQPAKEPSEKRAPAGKAGGSKGRPEHN